MASPPSFDALRADLWRTVARADIPEEELLQVVVEQLGPALGVSRACYNEPVDPSGDLVTVAEWCAPGVKPTLGDRIPAILLSPVERLGEFEVTVDSFAAQLPRIVRPVARPVLAALFRAQDLSSVFVMAYWVEGRAEGALTLDLVTAHARPEGWSAEVRPVVADALQIVKLAVERRRAQRERDISELRYRALVDRLAEGVSITDLEGKFILANRRAAEILGVPPGRLVGRSLRDFVDDVGWEIAREQTSRHTRGESSEYELSVRRPDGNVRLLLMACTPERDAAGQVTGTLGVFHDITERKRVEEEQRALELRVLQAQKLESLGILAGGIAHDFNNLLQVIRGNAELVEQGAEPGSRDARRLGGILRAAGRASDLARQMLAYAGRAPFRRERLRIAAIIDDIAQILAVSMPRKARLAIESPDGLPEVEGDRIQLQQVVLNLVINGAEALVSEGGTVTVRTGTRACDAELLARCELGDCAPGEYVFIEVTDTGEGMTPAVRARLFEPLFTTKFTGRGLGLSALLGIVQAHGGAVQVETAPGRGTRVTVLLPFAKTAPAHDDAAAGGLPPLEALPVLRPADGAAVLFVDDDEDIRELAESGLTVAGYRVLLARDGAEALDRYAAAREEVRCVILDLTMPRSDGLETLAALRHIDPAVRVILSSGFDPVELATGVDGPPAAAFLQKPYSVDALLSVLAEVLRG